MADTVERIQQLARQEKQLEAQLMALGDKDDEVSWRLRVALLERLTDLGKRQYQLQAAAHESDLEAVLRIWYSLWKPARRPNRCYDASELAVKRNQ